MSIDGYESKVSQTARDTNAAEHQKLKNEIASLQASMQSFEALKAAK